MSTNMLRSEDLIVRRRGSLKMVIAAASCNFLEMYDFMVFGYYAPAIAKAYFPTSSDFASLMLALATFGAGFLMRPFGALVLGAYIDRHGRRAGLVLILGLMALGTLSIAAMPTFASVGIIAPIVVVLGRLLQGLSAGAGVGGISVYLAEISTPGNEGFYVSWQSASQQVAVMLASLVGVGVNAYLPPTEVAQWGWRIPFALGCLVIPALFWIQQSLEETPQFQQQKVRPTTSAIFRSVAANWSVIAGGALLVIFTTVSFYLITAYTPTFATTALHLTLSKSLTVSLLIGISNFILLPIMGAVSDRVGRRPLLLVASALGAFSAYPAMLWMTRHPSFGGLVMVELWFSFVYSCYNGALIVHLTEIMPASIRTSSFALAYSVAAGVFGGFTPALCTWLIHTTHNKAMPGAWLTFAALVSFLASIYIGRQTQPSTPLSRTLLDSQEVAVSVE